MKRIFDILFVFISIFLIAFMLLNNDLIMKTYDFNLFGFKFLGPIFFYLLLIFLIYIFINWLFIRFIFVFDSIKENKLNKKIIKLQEEININKTELQANIIKEIRGNFDNTINNYTKNNKEYFDEKLKSINEELGKINAELGYLKKD